LFEAGRAIDDVRWTPRAVACITYTNAAVYEIDPLAITPAGDEPTSTLYDPLFCLNHIFRPFCHFVKGYKESFKVLPDPARSRSTSPPSTRMTAARP